MSLFRFLAAAAALFLSALVAKADFVFVGSWNVYHPDAPSWDSSPPDGPLAYTGQQAAALLFGGAPGNYVISTEGSDGSEINSSAWYDVIGFAGGAIFSQDYSSKYLGLYYGPTSGFSFDPNDFSTNAASAFVRDNLEFFGRINYAFRMREVTNVVPDTGSTLLLIVGSGCLFAVLRRRFCV